MTPTLDQSDQPAPPPPPPGFVPLSDREYTESLVRAAAEKHGVDPDHLVRMAKTESGMKLDGPQSSKGAIGPMQLMPGTAKDLGVDPHDPRQNVEGGARYFKSLLDRYDGDYLKASAAYNAGPGHVDSGKELPEETKNYVKSVAPPPPAGFEPLSDEEYAKEAASSGAKADDATTTQPTGNLYSRQDLELRGKNVQALIDYHAHQADSLQKEATRLGVLNAPMLPTSHSAGTQAPQADLDAYNFALAQHNKLTDATNRQIAQYQADEEAYNQDATAKGLKAQSAGLAPVPGMEQLRGVRPGPPSPPSPLPSPIATPSIDAMRREAIARNMPKPVAPVAPGEAPIPLPSPQLSQFLIDKPFGEDKDDIPTKILNGFAGGIGHIFQGAEGLAEPLEALINSGNRANYAAGTGKIAPGAPSFTPEVARQGSAAASELMHGVFGAATPWVLNAAAKAPAQVALSILAAGGTQAAVSPTLQTVGVPKEHAGLIADLSSLFAGAIPFKMKFGPVESAKILGADPLAEARDVLGVKEDTPWADVRSAFKQQAKETHPDLGGDPDLYRKTQAAYETLENHYRQVGKYTNAGSDQPTTKPTPTADQGKPSGVPAQISAPPAPLAPDATYATPEGQVRVRMVRPNIVVYEVADADGNLLSRALPIQEFRAMVGLNEPPAPPPPRNEVIQPEAPAVAAAGESAPESKSPENPDSSAAEVHPWEAASKWIKPSDISLDPVRFQFKQEGVGQKGVTGQFKDVTEWDPDLAGIVHVWQDPSDGKVYAVNGHHRVELAQRLGSDKVPLMQTRLIDAKDAREARAKGAFFNIAEGNGTALDIAKFFRDSGTTPEQLEASGKIKLYKQSAQQGAALSRLAQPIFDDVVSGKLKVQRAAVIGAGLPNKADQLALYDAINKREADGKRLTDDQVEEMISLAKGAPKKESADDIEQFNMFGEPEQVERSLIAEKAIISDYVRKQLSAEKKLFGIVGDQGAADRLSRTGNVIKADENANVAEQAKQGMAIYDKLRDLTGPVNDILNKAAQELDGGENANAVKQRAYESIRAEVQRQADKFSGVYRGNDSGPSGQSEGRLGEVGPGDPAPALASLFDAEDNHDLFPPETQEELERQAKLHDDRLTGARLTAQLRSGMAMKPARLKPQSGDRGLFEDNAPEQGGLFARNPDPNQLTLFGDAEERPRFTGYQFDPNSIERLPAPERPSAASGNMDIPVIRNYWKNAKAVSGTVGNYPAVFLNAPAMDALLLRMGDTAPSFSSAHVGGMVIDASSIANVQRASANANNSLSFHDALREVARALAQAASGNKHVAVIQAGKDIPDEKLKRVAEEEHDHLVQMDLPLGVHSLPVEILDGEVGKLAAYHLGEHGYKFPSPKSPFYDLAKPHIVAEIGVRLSRPGRYKELGLTYDQAVGLAEQYAQGLARHGQAADAIINQVYETIGKPRPHATQTPHSGGPGDLQAQPESGSEGRAVGRPGEAAVSSGAGFGSKAEVARRPLASMSNSERGAAPMLTDIAQGVVNKAKNAAGYIKAEARSMKNMSPLGDVFNRNLTRISKVSPEVDAATVKAASSQARAATILHAATVPMDNALKGSGITLPEVFQSFIESRLRGIREDLWQRLATDAMSMSDYDIMGAFTDHLVDFLDAIEGRGGQPKVDANGKPVFGSKNGPPMPRDLSQTAAALYEANDPESLREFLAFTFADAAERVATVMDPGEFDRIRAHPAYQKAKQIYKDTVEKEVRETHEQHEGRLSAHLGPEDTYYPLIPIGKQHPGPGMLRTPYGKGANVSNRLATGMSPAYDSTIESFATRLRSAIRASDKYAVLTTMEDTGWLQPESPRGAPAYVDEHGVTHNRYKQFNLPDGRIIPGVSVPVSKERVTIRPGQKAIVRPAKTGVIPLFMYSEMEPILEGKGYADATNILLKVIHGANSVALAGLAEPIFHARNIVGGLVHNAPFIAAAMGKSKMAQLRADSDTVASVFRLKPTEEEFAKDLIQMAKYGIVPDRFGRMSYDARTASLTDGKQVRFSIKPLIFGDKGLDIKSRWLMYKTITTLNPNASPREITDFVNQLGNYTYGLQGSVERWLKHTGLGPFATAGITGIRRGFHTWTGTGPNPIPGVVGIGLRMMTGALMTTIGWALVYHAVTGKWPGKGSGAKLGSIPITGALRQSALGKKMWGEGSDPGEVNLFAFHPDYTRGAKLFGVPKGYQNWNLGGNVRQVAEGAATDTANTIASPALGPFPRAMVALLLGRETYLTGVSDRSGAAGPQLYPAVPKKTGGIAKTAAWRGMAAAKELNSFYHDLATAVGLFPPNPDEKGSNVVRSVMNLALPGVVGNAYNPYKSQNYLRTQRQNMK